MLYHWAVTSFCIFQNIETEIMFRTTYHYPARLLHIYLLCYFCTPSPEVLASPLSVMGLGTCYFTSKARFKSRKAEYSGLSVFGVDNPPYHCRLLCCTGTGVWRSRMLSGSVWVTVRVSGLGLQADVPLALRTLHKKPENREVNEITTEQSSVISCGNEHWLGKWTVAVSSLKFVRRRKDW